MARAIKLTWQDGQGKRPGRWRKVYKGKAYVFDGGRGRSDMAGYNAAVVAWEAKRREVDLAEDRLHEPAYLKCLDEWQRILTLSLQHGDEPWTRRAEDKLVDLRRRLSETKLPPLREDDWFNYAVDPSGTASYQEWLATICKQTGLIKPLDADAVGVKPVPYDRHAEEHAQAAVWRDRLAQADRKAAPRGDSVREHVQAFLDDRQGKVASGKLSVSRLVALKIHLGKFAEWIGTDTSVKEIDGPTLLKYRNHVDTACKARTAGHRLEAVKTWVKWLWAVEAIDTLPRLFQSGELRIEKAKPDIKTFNVDQIKTLVAKASPKTRLYCLLGLNTGMTQVDVANLRRDEIDLERGTITRKRSKTRKVETVPTVTYLLWSVTLELLREQMGGKGALALVSENGRPLVSLGLDGKKTDCVKNGFFRLLKKTKLKGCFKMLRSTSATMLKDSEWHDLVDLFLGHAAAKMSDISYARAALGRLANALTWLAGKYGLIESTPATVSEQSAATPAAPSPSPEPVADEGNPKPRGSRSRQVVRRAKKSP